MLTNTDCTVIRTDDNGEDNADKAAVWVPDFSAARLGTFRNFPPKTL